MLNISRSSYYYKPKNYAQISNLCNQIYELWQKYSFLGYRKIAVILTVQNNQNINRKKVLRLMRLMGLQAIYAKPKTTITNKNEYKYPYLLKDLIITKPNQVWATDITYIKKPQMVLFIYVP